MAAAIARLRLDPQTLTLTVEDGVVRIAGKLARRSQLAEIRRAGRRIEGVVDLDVDATYDEDDLAKISPVPPEKAWAVAERPGP